MSLTTGYQIKQTDRKFPIISSVTSCRRAKMNRQNRHRIQFRYAHKKMVQHPPDQYFCQSYKQALLASIATSWIGMHWILFFVFSSDIQILLIHKQKPSEMIST